MLPHQLPTPSDTGRLTFGSWTEEDADIALRLWGDPEVTALLGTGRPWTSQEILQQLMTEIACQQEHGVQYWPMYLRAGGEHVGCCGLRPRHPDQGVWELGFHLRRKFWGEGLAAEAARAVIAFAFERLAAAALFAGHHPNNAPSQRLLRKLGFHYTHHEFYPPTGLKHPSYLLTAAQWKST
jgi:ribosomal-protein-alanine N-acetyltransferase